MASSSASPLHMDKQIQIKTKIICTIGPKTQSVEMLGKLVEAGMNVMRLNFSHGTHEYHLKTIQNLRTYLSGSKSAKIVGILLDTKGPEIRSGKLQNGQDVKLKTGQSFRFVTDQSFIGDASAVAVSYENLPKSVKPGDFILVDDGLISFQVHSTGPNFVDTIVQNDGTLGETKGVNLPNVKIDLPAITEKDRADIEFGIKHGVDFIAASFIRKSSDVLTIRDILGNSGIQIISKIENQEGLNNFEDILAVSDGVMVARGDLGVEIPVEKVARAQKMIIKGCNRVGKPCITATQMLESMIVNPRPTRAEATDVANAVLDGSDCVMLSGETAKGSYPIEAVTIMAKICREAEADINYSDLYANLRKQIQLPIGVCESIAASAVKTSWDIQSPMIIVLTERGQTARAICKYRPIPPVLGVSSSSSVTRQMQILRGIYPLLVDTMEGTENVLFKAMLQGVQMGMAEKGDPIVITSGVMEQVSGSTNVMRVKRCIGFEV